MASTSSNMSIEEEEKESLVKPHSSISGFQSPRKIFITWFIFVVLLHIFSPYRQSSSSKKMKSKLQISDTWPPADIMAKNIDDNKRVVVAVTSFSHIEMADNFLASLEANGVSNFVLVPQDHESHYALKEAYGDHVLPPMPASSGEKKNSDEPEYTDIVDSRLNILHAFLQAGYSTFYSDIDSVWQTNVWVDIEKQMESSRWNNSDVDGFFADDSRPDRVKQYSAAHMFLKPSDTTVSFIEKWSSQRSKVIVGDYRQSLNDLIKKTRRDSNPSSLTLNIDEMEMHVICGNKSEYPPGWIYFGTPYKKSYLSSQEKLNVKIVHNNFEKKYTKKIEYFKREGLWKPSGRLLNMTKD